MSCGLFYSTSPVMEVWQYRLNGSRVVTLEGCFAVQLWLPELRIPVEGLCGNWQRNTGVCNIVQNVMWCHLVYIN